MRSSGRPAQNLFVLRVTNHPSLKKLNTTGFVVSKSIMSCRKTIAALVYELCPEAAKKGIMR